MRKSTVTLEQSYVVEESGPIKEATSRLQKILDAKYEAIKISDVIKQSDHLSEMQQEELKFLLTKYEILFDGKLGHWETKSVDIELKEGAC